MKAYPCPNGVLDASAAPFDVLPTDQRDLTGYRVTDVEPPLPGEGEHVRWVGDITGSGNPWIVEPIPLPVVPDEPAPFRYVDIDNGDFATKLMTADQNDVWIALVDTAEQTPVADRTETQRQIIRAWRHFNLHGRIHMPDPLTQISILALYGWGVLGPVKTSGPDVDATPEEQAAIDHAARMGRGEPVPDAA